MLSGTRRRLDSRFHGNDGTDMSTFLDHSLSKSWENYQEESLVVISCSRCGFKRILRHGAPHTGDGVSLALEYRKRVPALSLPDCFGLALAQTRSWVLLSGDSVLNQLATDMPCGQDRSSLLSFISGGYYPPRPLRRDGFPMKDVGNDGEGYDHQPVFLPSFRATAPQGWGAVPSRNPSPAVLCTEEAKATEAWIPDEGCRE